MASTYSRIINGTGSISAGQPRSALNFLNLLRQLAVSAVDCIFDELGRDDFASARLACKALRDFVDANRRSVELHFSSKDTMNLRPRPGFISPLARLRHCSCVSICFYMDMESDLTVIQHPALLSSLCMSGVSADAARNITQLRLEGLLNLPTLVTVALVLAGTLRHVRILSLDAQECGVGGFNNLYAIHSTLRTAFPALEELNLPAKPCLRGLEAFAGSRLHTVRVMAEGPASLRMSHVRSLVQLPQLRQLDLDGVGPDMLRHGNDVWGDEEEEADDGAAGAAELPLGDASDEEMFRGMDPEEVQEVWALRRLLVSPPPALERLRWPGRPRLEIGFAGGSITCVDLYGQADGPDLHRAAAALLPALVAAWRRLPLLKVEHLADCPANLISRLQPHAPFSRLLAATDRVVLGRLHLGKGTTAEAAAALQAVVRAVGGLPEKIVFGSSGRASKLDLQTRPRYSAGAGGDRHVAGGATTAAAPAAVMLAEVTAQQVLERAAARMWDTAEAEAAATVARAEAAAAAYEADNSSWYRREELVRMHVLLRGPLVWQRTCGPDGAATGGGAAQLKEWLESLMARSPPPATAAAATPGSQTDAEASDLEAEASILDAEASALDAEASDSEAEASDSEAEASDSEAEASNLGAEASDSEAEDSDSDGLEVQRCSFAACGSGSALAVVECGDPIAALQLYRAAAAAASEAPGCLQVSACKAGAAWTVEISKVVRGLWDDHLRSAPVLAAPMAASGQGLAASGALEAGGQEERPGRAAVGHSGAAAGRDEAVALECDLQVLQRLLLLAEQAHEAVGRCK